jgi:hypothetical protein
MSSNLHHQTEHFKEHCLAWIALHHFLPAHFLRTLSWLLVDIASQGQLQFPQLFEEDMVFGEGGLSSWAARPREVSGSLSQYLQHRVRYFIWSNDGEVFYNTEAPENSNYISPRRVEDAVRLGRTDLDGLGHLENKFDFPPGDSVNKIVGALRIVKQSGRMPGSSGGVGRVTELCGSLAMPLRAVMLKHVGDLLADDDRWDEALELYRESQSWLEKEVSEAWTEYTNVLQSIAGQSIAAALRTIKGAAEAATYLVPRTTGTELAKNPLFLLNAAHDTLMAEHYASGTFHFGPDRRAAILLEPLLLKSHDLASALKYWSDREYREASAEFWSLLRRQIALGSSVEMRLTQAYYSRCIFDELATKAGNEISKSSFALGIRLIVQSVHISFAEKMRWDEALVRAYVDDESFDILQSHANAIAASSEERQRVAIELIHGWSAALPVERDALAHRMLQFIVDIGLNAATSFSHYLNLGGRCLAVLCDLAEKRPEFRVGIKESVAKLINAKMQKGTFWKAREDALKLASLYLDVMSERDTKEIVLNVLTQLEGVDPAREEWPIVRPSLDLITSDEIQALAKTDHVLNDRIVSTVLRFGLNQKTENIRLLYYLYHFSLGEKVEEAELSQVQNVVNDVRKQALSINASFSIGSICALLLASSVTGRAGVSDALEAIKQTLASAPAEVSTKRMVSLSFPLAYQAFLVLAERGDKIATDAGMEVEEFRDELLLILNLIINVWTVAKGNPSIFAQFSFPPRSNPDQIVVHNWTFGSMAFAKSIGKSQLSVLKSALDRAAENDSLKDGIASGRAARLASGDAETFTPKAIRSENFSTFYSALGQRLVFLGDVSQERRDDIVEALLDQCLRFGPNGLDAAVFLAAGETKVESRRTGAAYKNYLKRLENNRALRLTLMPFLVAHQRAGNI